MGKTEEIGCLLKFFAKRLIFFSIFVAFVFFLGGRHISLFIQLPQGPWMSLVVLGIAASVFTTLTMGILYGSQRFIEVSWDSFLSGFVKLLSGWIFVLLGWGILGGMMGFVLGFVVFLVMSAFQTAHQFPFEKDRCPKHLLDRREIYNYFFPTALCVFSLFALSNMDVILVKHFFSPSEAGHYSVAQIVGKIVLFLPSAVGVVMFPKIAEAQARGEGGVGILLRCLAVVAALCGAAFVFAVVFPDFILKVLTGQYHPESVGLVKWFAFSMSLYALVNIFGLYFLSLHKNGYIFALTVAVGLQAGGFWLFHESLVQILMILSVASALLMILGLFFMRRSISYEKSKR